MSARFPYLSPNPDVILPARDAAKVLFNREGVTNTNPTRVASLVDGGYFDNSGLGPALRLIEDQAKSKESNQRFVIHIFNDQQRTCNTKSTHSSCVRVIDKSLKNLKGFSNWAWLTRPIDAILAVREQHSLQRLNELAVAVTNLPIAKPLQWGLPMPEVGPNKSLEAFTHAIRRGAKLPLDGLCLRLKGSSWMSRLETLLSRRCRNHDKVLRADVASPIGLRALRGKTDIPRTSRNVRYWH